MIDLHVHTARCGHAQGSVAEYVQTATSLGLEVLGMTDHLPLPESVLKRDPRAAHYAMPELELADYVAEVTTAREAQGRSDHLELLLGIEADYIPDEQEYTRGLLSRYPFDVVLGSVHMIGDWAFDDPDLTDRYAEWDIGLLWDRYFIEVVAAARSGLFDVMGHVDLVKKFRFFPDGDLHERYVALARALADTGVAIEVNTAGLRKPCSELYPALPLLKECRRAGVPATIGSDAHTPLEVGFGYDLAADALREAGYDTVAVFKQRRLREVVL